MREGAIKDVMPMVKIQNDIRLLTALAVGRQGKDAFKILRENDTT